GLRLGEALVTLKLVTPLALADALGRQARNRSLPLGELLVNHGLITRDELREALEIKRAQQPAQPTLADAPAALPELKFVLDAPTVATPETSPPPPVAPTPAEQARGREKKGGEALLGSVVTPPAELAAALDAQSRMPMVRIGEALIALGFI